MARRCASGMASLYSSIGDRMMVRIQSEFEQEVCRMYERLFSKLPKGAATLTIRPSIDPAGGIDVLVVPTNPRSAPINTHILGETAYMRIGQSSLSEILIGPKATTAEATDTIRQMSEAVIDGRFSEDLWFDRGRVVKAIGTMKLSGRKGRLRYQKLFNPLTSKAKQHFDYAPYAT
jgi:hypothetical protein